jgi:predicted nucleic acid-binding Zn ribbon protein
MPLYPWECSQCSLIIDVLRDMPDYEVPPTEEEKQCECKAEMRRLIGSDQQVNFAQGSLKGRMGR